MLLSLLVTAGLYIQPCLATLAAYRLGHALAQLITNNEAEQAGPRGDPVSSEPTRPLLNPSFPAANAGRTGRTILPVAEEKERATATLASGPSDTREDPTVLPGRSCRPFPTFDR